jgi:hypothetical protein
MDNLDRAESASSALAKFSQVTGMCEEDTRTQMVDLVTNLMHLANKHSIDFDAVHHTAELHFGAEIKAAINWI